MQETLDFINKKTNNFQPEIGIILGSGLGDFADKFPSVTIPYSKIPHFESSTVQGHAGRLVFAETGNGEQETGNGSSLVTQSLSHPVTSKKPFNHSTRKIVMMQGRFHFYEGHPMEKVVYPVKVMKKLGVKTLIVTNAAGAVNEDLKPADLMIITDHINFMGKNPLFGANDATLGARFPDMSEIYKKHLIKIAEDSAQELGISIKKGVYAASSGPSYETPAEVNMFRILGANAVGMSTVPEAVVANYCGMDVLGISCISNYAAGVIDSKLSHKEVIETTNIAKDKFQSLLLKILEKI